MNTHRNAHFSRLGRRAILGLTVPALLLAMPAQASDPPETIYLTGVVRDFPESHPDMERRPDSGFGLYTGNVHQQLGPNGKPVFTGEGAKVLTQFKNEDGLPIAPHLFNRRFECHTEHPEVLCVTVSMASAGQGGLTKYKVCLAGEPEFNGDGTSTWRYTVEEIQGHKLSHWTLWLPESLENRIVRSETTVGGDWIGSDHPNFPGPGYKWDIGSSIPSEFVLTLDGHYFGTNASWAQAKGGPHDGSSEGNSPFFGPSSKLSNNGTPYETVWYLEQDSSLNDQEGGFGEYDTGGITSEESFNQWFNDVEGVNVSQPLTIALRRQPDGSYVFDDKEDPKYSNLGGFFPIEHQLFGQSGGTPDRNFHFTYELHTRFTFIDDENNPQYFRFTGDDDVWVFINGQLVIDLGGVHSALDQIIELDRMCLVDGEQYTISFFFAERHRTEANCRIQTNIELETDRIPPTTVMFD